MSLESRPNRPSKLRAIGLGLLVLIGAFGLFLAWPKHTAVAGGRPMGPPPGAFAIPVTIGAVSKQPTESVSEYLAQVHSDTSVVIRSSLNARLDRILVTDGQTVRQGQVLFVQDPGPQRELVNSLQAFSKVTQQDAPIIQKQMLALQADKTAVSADLQFAQTQLSRYESLSVTNTIAKKDLEQAQTAVTSLQEKLHAIDANIQIQQAKLKQERAAVERDTANVRQAKTTLGFYTIRAPFTGTIGEVTARVGDVVDPSIPLATLTRNDAAEIDIAIPADQISQVHMGSPLRVLTAEGHPVAQGSVCFISPKVEASSQTVLVKATVTNPTLLADQKLRVQIVWKHAERLQIPTEAVFRLAGQPFVYVAEAGKTKGKFTAHMRPVTLDGLDGNNAIVASGLTDGQRIVVHGVQKLQEGATVMDTSTMGPPPSKPFDKEQ